MVTTCLLFLEACCGKRAEEGGVDPASLRCRYRSHRVFTNQAEGGALCLLLTKFCLTSQGAPSGALPFIFKNIIVLVVNVTQCGVQRDARTSFVLLFWTLHSAHLTLTLTLRSCNHTPRSKAASPHFGTRNGALHSSMSLKDIFSPILGL